MDEIASLIGQVVAAVGAPAAAVLATLWIVNGRGFKRRKPDTGPAKVEREICGARALNLDGALAEHAGAIESLAQASNRVAQSLDGHMQREETQLENIRRTIEQTHLILTRIEARQEALRDRP